MPGRAPGRGLRDHFAALPGRRTEQRYNLSRLAGDAARFLTAVRAHWAIGNRRH
jgi:hypothetical protein